MVFDLEFLPIRRTVLWQNYIIFSFFSSDLYFKDGLRKKILVPNIRISDTNVVGCVTVVNYRAIYLRPP